MRIVQTTISNSIESKKDITTYFNGDIAKRFSLEQTILAKKEGNYQFCTTGMIEIGDIITQYNGSEFVEIEVTQVDLIDEERFVYQLDASPTDVILAGSLVVHNKKAFA